MEPHLGSPAKTSRYYRPELDLLRFFAFFLVFNHHLLPMSFTETRFHFFYALQEAGAAGVCLFFMLSAFLITELLLREKDATGRIHIRAFYVRRALRIWPLYLAAVTLSAILPHLSRHFAAAAAYVAPFLLLCGNWAIVLHRSWPANPLLAPLWSISVEEQFYLVWPAMLSRWGARAIAPVAWIILPLAWSVDLTLPALHASKDPQLWLNSISQFQFFAIGALLALFSHRQRITFPAPVRLAMFLAGFGCLLLAGYPFHFLNPAPTLSYGQVLAGYLAIDVACPLLLLSLLGARLPGFCRPLVYLGRISYGLYVFHYVIRLLVGNIAAIRLHAHPQLLLPATYLGSAALTIAVAAASYHFFERPFLKIKDRFTFVQSRPA